MAAQLSPSHIISLISCASSAINALEDNDPAREQERQRLRGLRGQRVSLEQHVAALRELIDAYTPYSFGLDSLLDQIHRRLVECIAGESEPRLATRNGRPRRFDHDHFAAVIVAVAQESEDGNLSAAARTVASFVDDVWSHDPRTKAPDFGKALWGESYSLDPDDRVTELAEDLRKKAQAIKKTIPDLS